MPFDIAPDPGAEIVIIDEDPYVALRYTGTDGGLDSFFHATGYLLSQYGLYDGGAATLRRLVAKAILALWEHRAAPMIDQFLDGGDVTAYVDDIAKGRRPGDLLCMAAVEYHFEVRMELREGGGPSRRLRPHFCPVQCDTMYVELSGGHHFVPLNHPELPALESDNYCLTCGVGVPNPLESICDDCVRRPRFCTSCAIAYVERGSVCPDCTRRLQESLVTLSERFAPTDFEAITSPCPLEQERARLSHSSTEEARPRFVVYLSNAPFDDFRSGDGTYIDQIVKWVNNLRTLAHGGLTYDVASFRVCDTGLSADLPSEEADTPLIRIPYIEGWPTSKSDTEKMTMAHWQKYYEPARRTLFKALAALRDEDKHPKSVHVFHVQVRYPDSGALFNRELLEALQRARFHVVVTCHEMKFNLVNAENMQRNVVQMNEFVACADRTIFLNEHDLMCGVKLIDQRSVTRYVAGSKRLGSQVKVREGLEKFYKEGESGVHPSGHPVDDILCPPRRKEAFYHVPGIATVGGVAFDGPAILRRPTNVLVFGLIKQTDAMKASADVAEAMLAEPRLARSRVFVVGKVFKNFQHSAIATLVGKMCGYTNKGIASLQRAFDQIGNETDSDPAFYEGCMKLIASSRSECESAWNGLVGNVCDPVYALANDVTLVVRWDESPYHQSPISPGVISAQQRLNPLDLAPRATRGVNHQTFKAELLRLQLLVTDIVSITNELDRPLYENRGLGEGVALFGQQVFALRKNASLALKAVKAALLNEDRWPSPPLPIEIVFNASPTRFQEIASGCKYAFKVDQKSMADNASSIISLMANGCIVFTESRFDTPQEYYAGGGRLSPVVMPPQKYGSCEGAFVVQNILAREDDPSLNEQTIKNMQTLLTKRYGLASVAQKHLIIYKTFLA